MRLLISIFRQWSSDYRPPSGRTGELFLESSPQDPGAYRQAVLLSAADSISGGDCGGIALVAARVVGFTSIHFHVWLAIVFGGLLTSLPVYLIRACPAAR